MWEFRLPVTLQRILDARNKTSLFYTPRPPTRLFAYLQQAFSTELATPYFYSPGPYSKFKAKSFKAYGLLTSTCCHEPDYYTWQRQQTELHEMSKRKKTDKFSQTEYTEPHPQFVWTGIVALKLMDQHHRWQTLPPFTTTLQHNHLLHHFLNKWICSNFKSCRMRCVSRCGPLCCIPEELPNPMNWENIKRNIAFCLWQWNVHKLIY